jgi:tight adherence protein B
MLILLAIGVFLAVVLALEGVYYGLRMWSKRGRGVARFAEKVEKWSTDVKSIDESVTIVRSSELSAVPWLNTWFLRNSVIQKLERLRVLAGGKQRVGQYLLYGLGSALGLGFVAVRVGVPFLLAGAMVLGGAVIPFLLLYRKKVARQRVFDRQFPETLDLLARSLRAGHTLFIGLKLVGEEFEEPIGPEFKLVFDEVSMGIPTIQAFENFAARVASSDVHYLVSAVNIQRETGGNLVEIMEALAWVIRQRFKLKQKVSALAGEGKISAVILCALPVLLGLVLSVISPHYVTIFIKDPTGHIMLTVAAVMLGIGVMVMSRMTSIKV